MSNTEHVTPSIKETWAARRKNFRPRAVNMSEAKLVEAAPLRPDTGLPLVVRPSLGDVSLAEWASHNRDYIERSLLRHGGILFRGFGLADHDDFDRFLTAVALERMYYMEGATPRVELREKVYTSTEYPSDQSIALHNELNYVVTWPMKILFFCVTAAETGGETPIADVRRVYDRIDPKIRQRFSEKGWMLVRNFGEHMSLPWQTSFRLDTRAEMEEYCRKARVVCEWRGGDRLTTRQVRPAVRRHPRTGEMVWFNHVAFWHVSSLAPEVREMFLAEFQTEDLPYNTYYGDGQPIEDSVVEELREAYRQETVAFLWEPGDLLMMDNMLVAHGRSPFTGPRKILVGMGEPCNGEAG